ncbi:hypothetical protein HDU86_008480 [Geranomyces michiganensis]|nr:hypothetical protein HDU86_008480 [Geranomyces michiganensis]
MEPKRWILERLRSNKSVDAIDIYTRCGFKAGSRKVAENAYREILEEVATSTRAAESGKSTAASILRHIEASFAATDAFWGAQAEIFADTLATRGIASKNLLARFQTAYAPTVTLSVDDFSHAIKATSMPGRHDEGRKAQKGRRGGHSRMSGSSSTSTWRGTLKRSINNFEPILGLCSGGLPQAHRAKYHDDLTDLAIAMRDVLYEFYNANSACEVALLRNTFVIGVHTHGWTQAICTY